MEVLSHWNWLDWDATRETIAIRACLQWQRWHYCIWSRKSRVFETAPFFVIVNSKKNWQQKVINSNKYSRWDRFYLFCALEMQKHQFWNRNWIFFASEFSFSAKFCDLLTSDDAIDVLICISSLKFYRVFQWKHFEVWLIVLWFTVLKIMTIFLSPAPKLSSCLSSERRTWRRHFWSYCRVTKSLPSLFCYARRFSSWK